MTLEQSIQSIIPVDTSLLVKAKAHLDNLTKPRGSLARLEELAARLFCIQNGVTPLAVDTVRLFTVAADHGIAEEGVSPYPQEVTRQMVLNFLAGGAAINVLCREARAELYIVDAGCKGGPFAQHAQLIDKRLGEGTANFAKQSAMSRQTCQTALQHGIDLATQAITQGCKTLAIGEMGIGNTTAATALFCAYLSLDPKDITGPGAGASPEGVSRKADIIARALALHAKHLQEADAIDTLACVGGFEIAVMAGIILGAAKHRCCLLVDGFIATSAYVAARHICPAVAGYCILSHVSAEPGYAPVIEALGDTLPLLHLQLRLGEGTGAALAIPLVRAAAAIYNDMATFSQAGVTEETCS